MELRLMQPNKEAASLALERRCPGPAPAMLKAAGRRLDNRVEKPDEGRSNCGTYTAPRIVGPAK
jgi:hypothetical protein